MKIAMCLIVYNGQPYISKWLDHYINCPDIDYVCVAEGATRNMVEVHNLKTPASTDGTRDIIAASNCAYSLCESAYPEKVDMQNEYMSLVPDDTDYIFVADVDEFYHYADIAAIKQRLISEQFTYVEFKMYHFWKSANWIGVGGQGWGYDMPIDRIFKTHPGARFTSHRPVTLLNEQCISVKNVKPLLYTDNPIMCYHYSYVTEKNVYEKMMYYTKTFGRDYMKRWFYPVWKRWNEDTRYEIEGSYSIHPTVPGAKTKRVELTHPICVTDLA